MSKISSALTAALLVQRASPSAAQSCEGIISEFAGECTYDNFVANLDASCNVTELFAGAEGTPEEEVAELCEYDAPVHFVEAQGTYQKDRRYFAGGGIMSDGRPDKKELDLANLMRFDANRHGKSIIKFPEYAARFEYNNSTDRGDARVENGYPANMNLESSCGLRTLMCCFADATGDAFPSTTDVCHHDLHDSPQSNHIEEGWSFFSSEHATHCVGTTWEEGGDELLGNILYDISIHNTLNKGYIHNIPGAPMCGCVEHMPAVETASCRTATRTGDVEYVFKYDPSKGYVTADNFADISYGPCDEPDLAAQYMSTKATQEEKDLILEHLVGEGNCEEEIEEYLNADQFYLQRQVESKYLVPDAAQWSEIVVGEGIYFMPPGIDPQKTDEAFRALINAGCSSTLANGTVVERHCMVRRVCPSCTKLSHRDVYYQRRTDLPPFGTNRTAGEVYFLDLFMNNWYKTPANQLSRDFDLYSSYDDALADENAWTYCNYNAKKEGFPRDCGPTGYVGDQWNSYTKSGGYANDHAFYVELPSSVF